jgi:hypothetical protein
MPGVHGKTFRVFETRKVWLAKWIYLTMVYRREHPQEPKNFSLEILLCDFDVHLDSVATV